MKERTNKISRRTFLKSGLVAGGMGALGFPTVLRAQSKEVKVGLLAPLTGVSASWGQRSYWGFLLAAQLINEAGGIKSMGGTKVKIVVGDTESKPEVAGIQAEKLIADKEILLLTGTNQSAAGMVATQVAERNRICYITGIDGAPQITQRGFQYTYRTCPTMVNYGKDLVYFAKDMGKETGKAVKKFAILCENSVFGVSGGDEAAKYGKEVGFDLVDYSTYDATTTRDFTGYISKYKSAGVDFLVCHNRPQDGVLITRTMKELNFNPLCYGGMFGTHAIYEFAEALGKDSDYTYATTNFTDEATIPGLKKITEMYKKQYNVAADANMLAAFAVMPVLQAALEKSPGYDREKFKQVVDKIEVKTGEYNNLQIDGIKWDANHDNAWVQSFVVIWQKLVQYPVAPPKFAVKKPVWPRPTWDKI